MVYSPFRHIGSVLWKGGPIQLTFFVTKRCNAKCPFCFYLSEGEGQAVNEPELSLEEVKQVSASMGDLLWLAFSGGEIFLREDIVEITKVFYEQNRPAIILFPTNGLMTGVIREKMESILKHCKNSTIALKLSLEGMEEIHDRIRGEGSFYKTMQTYDAMKGLLERYPNFELGINTVFCSINQNRMGELINFVTGLDKVKTHTVSLIRGAVSDEGLKDIDLSKYKETIDSLASNLRSRVSGTYRFKGARLKAAQDILQRNLIYRTLIRNKQMVPCYAGKLNLVLTETGDVYPCESFDLKLGNVRRESYNMNKILRTDTARRVIRSIRKKGCFCTHECYLMTNILFNAGMYPSLFREYLRI